VERASGAAAVAAGALTLLAAYAMTVSPGSHLAGGVATYNLDPAFTDENNDLVWDPNFLPALNATPNVALQWTDPTGGPGTIDYAIGPWANNSSASLPHFSVGPQAFNFVEVPRTQAYRSPVWGDYAEVHQGFLACAVNQGNLTVTPTAALHPVYVGMPEGGVDWSVQLDLDWEGPQPLAPGGAGLVALTMTTALPPLPGSNGSRLAYTQLILWSAQTPTLGPAPLPNANTEGSIGSDVFALDSLSSLSTHRSYSIDLSGYLADTVAALAGGARGGLLSYVYLEVDGYNWHVHLAIDDLYLRGPAWVCGSALVASLAPPPPASVAAAPAALMDLGRDGRRRAAPGEGRPDRGADDGGGKPGDHPRRHGTDRAVHDDRTCGPGGR
jgi:hypothetical protein